MSSVINVVILDDHTMILRGIEMMLQDCESIKVSASFNQSKELLGYLKNNSPDIILMDINLPDIDGITLCKLVTRKYPSIKIIGLSNFNDANFIKNMIRNGAKSYLLKNTGKDEIVYTINEVYKGNTFLPKPIEKLLLNDSLGRNSNPFIPKLTRREKEILNCIANELTNNETADKLFISVKTVESHRKNLLQKFSVKNTAGLIREAVNKGLI